MPDWTNGEWVDATKFVAWLNEHGITFSERGPYDTEARRVRRYVDGEAKAASLAAVDRILTSAGRHISELPDDLWLERPPRRQGRVVPIDVRKKAVEMYASGMSAGVVGKELGVDPKSVRMWAFRDDVNTLETKAAMREQKRKQVLELVAAGKTPTEISREVGVHRRTVYDWRKAAA